MLKQLVAKYPTWEKMDEVNYLWANILFEQKRYRDGMKYLADLKIVRRFKEALVRDILELLEALPVMADLDQLVVLAAKRHALNPESLRTAIERLGIETQLDFQPASAP